MIVMMPTRLPTVPVLLLLLLQLVLPLAFAAATSPSSSVRTAFQSHPSNHDDDRDHALDQYRFPDHHHLLNGNNVCTVQAVADNHTLATDAFNAALKQCHAQHPDGAVVYFPGPNSTAGGPAVYRVDSSIALQSNVTVLLGANVTLQFAITPEMPVFQNPACPSLFWAHGGTALLCGTNLTNVALRGVEPTTSRIDGGGWPWYEAGMANKSMWGQGPRTFEVAWTSNVTVSSLTFTNSPSWTVHPTFCNGVLAESISILNPRFTPNTDGFDPDSCTDVVLRDSIIDTGDDGISVKSTNSTVEGCGHIQVPARNIHIYNTTVLSRNFCVGSATFGGVYDLVMEDCTIGNDEGSSPWAIKYKSHQAYPGAMVNHTFRRIRVGNIQPNDYQQPNGGYFMSIELRYHPLIPNRTCAPWKCPVFKDIHFEDMVIAGAHRAGDVNGFEGDLLEGLTFKNVTWLEKPSSGWAPCGFVDLDTFSDGGMDPPLKCSRGPARS